MIRTHYFPYPAGNVSCFKHKTKILLDMLKTRKTVLSIVTLFYLFYFAIKLDKLHVKRKLFNKALWFCFRKKSNPLIICKRNGIGSR